VTALTIHGAILLVTGERFGGGDAVTAAAARAIKSAAAEEAADKRTADKAAKKAAFDTEYDVGAPAGLAVCPASPVVGGKPC
jgi:hypothetical protein